MHLHLFILKERRIKVSRQKVGYPVRTVILGFTLERSEHRIHSKGIKRVSGQVCKTEVVGLFPSDSE